MYKIRCVCCWFYEYNVDFTYHDEICDDCFKANEDKEKKRTIEVHEDGYVPKKKYEEEDEPTYGGFGRLLNRLFD